MRHQLRVCAVVVVVVTAVVVSLTATTAGAVGPPAVTCGQTITTSVVLRADLACAGDGLIITANNVTVLAGRAHHLLDRRRGYRHPVRHRADADHRSGVRER